MATKKSTKKQSSKKQTSKSGSRKKPGSKKLTSRSSRGSQFQQIPPIIVGGGSAFVWLRTDYRPVVINIPRPPGPYPVEAYDCFKFEYDVSSIEVHDGQNPHDPVPVADHRRHRTVFRQ